MMETSGIMPAPCRKFTVPFGLLSVIFAGPYIFAALWSGLWALNMLALGLTGGPLVTVSRTDAFSGMFPVPFMSACSLVSLAGALLILYTKKSRSRRWKSVVPLCLLLGWISILSLAFPPRWLYDAINFPGLVWSAGFLVLPYGIAGLLEEFSEPEAGALGISARKSGLFGLGIAAVLALMPVASPWIFQINGGIFMAALDVAVFLSLLLQVFVLMPYLGFRIFRLGLPCAGMTERNLLARDMHGE